jgi:hypothetical protein
VLLCRSVGYGFWRGRRAPEGLPSGTRCCQRVACYARRDTQQRPTSQALPARQRDLSAPRDASEHRLRAPSSPRRVPSPPVSTRRQLLRRWAQQQDKARRIPALVHENSAPASRGRAGLGHLDSQPAGRAWAGPLKSAAASAMTGCLMWAVLAPWQAPTSPQHSHRQRVYSVVWPWVAVLPGSRHSSEEGSSR